MNYYFVAYTYQELSQHVYKETIFFLFFGVHSWQLANLRITATYWTVWSANFISFFRMDDNCPIIMVGTRCYYVHVTSVFDVKPTIIIIHSKKRNKVSTWQMCYDGDCLLAKWLFGCCCFFVCFNVWSPLWFQRCSCIYFPPGAQYTVPLTIRCKRRTTSRLYAWRERSFHTVQLVAVMCLSWFANYQE